MKKINIKLIIVSFLTLLMLAVGTLSGCITIAPPAASTPPPAPAVVPTPTPTPINPNYTPPPVGNETANLPSIADVVAAVKPSVVAITTEVVTLDFFNRPFTQKGAGSGWIIDESGIIVTNNHVVEGAKTITVTLDDDTTYTADIKAVFTDPLNDLAIIKIDARGLPALKIGNSDKLRIGDWVVAIGNALGQGTRATEGIVSRQKVSIPVSQGQTLYDLLETSAAINPGNSGGPLVNLAGEVIGITSAKIASVGVEGMGYAIATKTAVPILEELIKNGYVARPWLGVGLYTVDQFAISRYNLKIDTGILLVQVVPDSPAAKAGLQEGDVIISISGEEVTNVQELTRFLHSSKIGQPLEIVFWRGATKNTTQVTPLESPPPP